METEILFHNRTTKSLQKEEVYGERWLSFIYGNPLGRICLWVMVKRAWFSKWYGWQMNRKKSASKIIPFIEKFGLQKDEFLDDTSSFQNFNEFFYRKLKRSSRPFDPDAKSIVFPADGRHFAYQNINENRGVFVKGQKFKLKELFNSSKLAKNFEGGTLVLSRLCPTDYHRFHFPVSGILKSVSLINGQLSSVNPIALRQSLSIFWENKRYLSIIQNDQLGQVAVFLIGATCVGSVHTTIKTGAIANKGDEMGYFSFGGSSLITIFQPNKIKLDDELCQISSTGFETYAKMGETMGKTF